MKKYILCAALIGMGSDVLVSAMQQTTPRSFLAHQTVPGWNAKYNPVFMRSSDLSPFWLSAEHFDNSVEVHNALWSLPKKSLYRATTRKKIITSVQVGLTEDEYKASKQAFLARNQGIKVAAVEVDKHNAKKPAQELSTSDTRSTRVWGVRAGIITAALTGGAWLFTRKFALAGFGGLKNMKSVAGVTAFDAMVVSGIAAGSFLMYHLARNYKKTKISRINAKSHDKWHAQLLFKEGLLDKAKNAAKELFGNLLMPVEFSVADVMKHSGKWYKINRSLSSSLCAISYTDVQTDRIEVFEEEEKKSAAAGVQSSSDSSSSSSRYSSSLSSSSAAPESHTEILSIPIKGPGLGHKSVEGEVIGEIVVNKSTNEPTTVSLLASELRGFPGNNSGGEESGSEEENKTGASAADTPSCLVGTSDWYTEAFLRMGANSSYPIFWVNPDSGSDQGVVEDGEEASQALPEDGQRSTLVKEESEEDNDSE